MTITCFLTRETIEKIIKALELNEQEKGEFLLVGGYLPTGGEIKKVIKEVSQKLIVGIIQPI